MITTATQAGGSKPNEDWVGATDRVAVVLDGLSAPEGVSGCTHGTPWYVSRLGAHLLENASKEISLRSALFEAIQKVSAEHTTCDLADPGTPSSTVAVVRVGADQVEALVLADSPVVVDTPLGPDVLTDRSVDTVVPEERAAALQAPTGTSEKASRMATLVRAQRLVRNTDNGYWIAGSHPEAANHALERTWRRQDVNRFAAMSDGVSCLVDLYEGASWQELLTLAEARGPESVIDRVRKIESMDPEGVLWPRYKAGDDAAIAYGSLIRPL